MLFLLALSVCQAFQLSATDSGRSWAVAANQAEIVGTAETYTGANNKNIRMESASVVVNGNNAVIDCEGDGFALDLFSGTFVFEDITVQNCVNAVTITSASVVFRRVVFRDNVGIHAALRIHDASVQLVDCVFEGNSNGALDVTRVSIHVVGGSIADFNSAQSTAVTCADGSMALTGVNTAGVFAPLFVCPRCQITVDGSSVCEDTHPKNHFDSRCGLSYPDAAARCGTVCTSHSDCPGNLACYSDIYAFSCAQCSSPAVAWSEYDAWSSSTVYTAGDVVSHNGRVFRANWWTQANTPGVGDNTNDGDWWTDLGAGTDVGLVSSYATCRPYSAGFRYEAGDVVTHNGRVFRALVDSINITPVVGQFWEEIGSLGSWNGATDYPIGSVVSYGGGIYMAVGANRNVAPSDVWPWELLSRVVSPKLPFITITFTLSGSVDDFDATSFVRALARLLGLDVGFIEVVSVSEGSVVVEARVSGTTEAEAQTSANTVLDAVEEDDEAIEGYKVEKAETSSRSVEHGSSAGAVVAVIIVLMVVLGVAVVVALAVYKGKRTANTKEGASGSGSEGGSTAGSDASATGSSHAEDSSSA